MLFLYGLILKILSKLGLGPLLYPFLKKIANIFHVSSLPTVNNAKYIISNNIANKYVKSKKFYFKHEYSNVFAYDIQIVIPVYNSKKYIRKCLNSVLNQKTDYKYQIIVVNDGSTDGTDKILKEYSNNSLIKIINEENYGSSVARNTGLRFVNSRYVMFVDSDDELTSYAIQDLLSTAYKNGSDVVLGGSYHLFNNGKITKGNIYENCNDFDITNSYYMNHMDGGPCAKIFKSCLFKGVYFPEGYEFEDMMLFFLIYTRCKKISSISSFVYFYRINYSSVSHKFKFSDISIDSFLLLSLMMKLISKYNITINQYIYNTFLNQVKATGMRNIYINTKIQKSIFMLICCLYDKYFKQFSTNINFNIPLENCLKKRDYMGYILFCIMK